MGTQTRRVAEKPIDIEELYVKIDRFMVEKPCLESRIPTDLAATVILRSWVKARRSRKSSRVPH